MKVLMLNGSAKKEGNTYQSLLEVGKELERQGIEYEIFQIGSQPVRDCIGCGQCNENGCVFADDKVNEFVAPPISSVGRSMAWIPLIAASGLVPLESL